MREKMTQNNLYPQDPILIIDDDAGSIEAIKSNLIFNHINNIKSCLDSRKCLDILKNEKISTILLDLNMPLLSGDQLLPKIKEQFPNPESGTTIVLPEGGELRFSLMNNEAALFLYKGLDINLNYKTFTTPDECSRAISTQQFEECLRKYKIFFLKKK